MKNELSETLLKIFGVLSSHFKREYVNYSDYDRFELLTYDKRKLFEVNKKQVILPGNISLEQFFIYKSSLKNKLSDLEKVSSLISNLSSDKSFLLNHIGICYKTDSKNEERNKLKKSIGKIWNLYEMKSTDESLWLFVGDTKNWQNALIEFLPVEKTTDPNFEIWFPHIHIDIDTGQTAEKIEETISNIFQEEIKPYRLSIYSIRIRLGIVSGVNIMIDFGTDKKRTEYARKNLLVQL